MKYLFILFLFFSSPAFTQELKLVIATKQTVNAGASPTSIVNYVIFFEKDKNFNWSIDSVVNVLSQQSVQYKIEKVNNLKAVSDNCQPQKSFSKRDKGLYRITFSAIINHTGVVHPGAPVYIPTPIIEFSQGAIVYYSSKKIKKQLKIESFKELDTIDAP